jgi:hypothetical protein
MKNNDRLYTIFISSDDKIFGTNNNANFDINFASFLPQNKNIAFYKLRFTFNSNSGIFEDDNNTKYSSAILSIDFGNKALTYDANTKSASNKVGFLTLTPTGYNNLLHKSGVYIKPPQSNIINVKLVNTEIQNAFPNQLLMQNTTTSIKSDFPSWNMTIELQPLYESL